MDNKEKIGKYYGVVIGDWHYNSLGLIRSLGEKNVPVIYMNTRESGPGEKSKYTVRTYHIASEDEIVDVLKKIVAEYGGVPVLFPGGDKAALSIDAHYDELKNWCICPGFEGKAAFYMDKSVMGQYAEQAGFVVPKSCVVPCDSRDVPALTFPIILKPLKSVDGVKSDIAICRTEEEYKTSLADFHQKGYPNILVQSFVDGKNNVMVGYSGCRSKNGKTFVFGEVRKIREFPVGRGSTSFAYVSDTISAIDKNIIYKFMDAVDYDGVFDLDIKIVDGVPYFLESNFRNGGLSYAYTVAGFNIPYTWFCEKTGLPEQEFRFSPVNLMCERDDFENLKARNISLFKWLRDIASTQAPMVFSRADPAPFIDSYGKSVNRLFSCLFRNVK